MSAPGWYPDPGGAKGQQRYWDGQAWGPPAPKPGQQERKPLFIVLVIVGLILAAVVVDVATGNDYDDGDAGASLAQSSPSSIFVPTQSSVAPPPAAPVAPAVACNDAPNTVLDMINSGFTDGEVLDNAQAVDLPNAMTLIGGDINSASGSRESSRDSWLYSDGVLYAITSDARRRSLFADGRDVAPNDWGLYNDALANCVGRIDSATPG